MSLFVRGRRSVSLADVGVNPRMSPRRGLVHINSQTALRHSAVWACLRIRADLLSTFPVDVFRKVDGIDVEMPKSPILVDTGGKHWPFIHWLWASQFELDRGGNTIGLITERNALGLPARIDLQPIDRCSVFQRKDMPEHKYKIEGKEYTADQVWHDRQFPVPGLPVGLSPIAFAAYTLQEALTMQQFALDWFGGGAVPKARLHNTKKSLENSPENSEARRIKDRYMATVANGDIFVHGMDWELDFLQAEAMGTEWLEGRRATVPDIARYFGCPVDLIEAAIEAPGSITYQSALQRNLQLLVIHLNPAVVRREDSLSRLLPRPRYVKFNTDALLRMDPETMAKVIGERIKSRTLAPSEARKFYNQQPFTPAQIEEFTTLFGAPRTAPNGPTAAAAEDPFGPRFYEQVSPLSVVPYPVSHEVE